MQPTDHAYQTIFKTLHEMPLFEKLDETTLHNFLKHCKLTTWSKSETIDSDRGLHYCHILLSGRLKILEVDPITGRSIAPFLLTTGDIYDLFCLLDGKPHEVQPVTLDSVTALYVPIETAREWIHTHPRFNEAFLPYLGKMMRRLEMFGESVVFDDTATRLSKLILHHVDSTPSDNHYPVKLINNLSHESLAEMIGSVRSVVNTQLKRLKEEQILLSRRGHLAVKNLEALLRKIEKLSS